MNSQTVEVHGQPGEPLGMPPQRFLHTYWQKHPLLIRGAFPDFTPPLRPDDLGGLACEDGVLSRLIEHDREHDQWTVHNGPLAEDLFARLPDRDWTVLVQDADKWDADVARLLEPFRFLPSWRIDDIMVSYAEDGGGVGAHIDQYDVFLLQGHGKRRWSIDTGPNPPTEFRDDVELKQLHQFTPTHTWTLEPGDLLYLPPGVPHDGVAEGPCMTFSIGMRAPAAAELQLDLAEFLAERLPESQRYTDPDLVPTTHSGEIDAPALTRVAAALGSLANGVDRDTLADWFGRFITRYRCAQFAAPPEHVVTPENLATALQRGGHLLRNPWTRMAWVRHADGCTLFVSGDAYPCAPELAQRLCHDACFRVTALPTGTECALITTLINQGHLLQDHPPPAGAHPVRDQLAP